MNIPSKESRIKRLKLVGLNVLIPLTILMLVIYISFAYFGYVFFPISKGSSNEVGYVEPNVVNLPTTDSNIKVNNPDSKDIDPVPVKQPTKVTPKPATTSNWWEYPSKIYLVTKSGNDLLVLVNKKYKLPSSYAPSDLVLAEKSGIRVKAKGTYYVRKILINDLKELNTQAKKDGIDLSVISAYRSYSTQKSTYDYWVKYNNGCVSCADRISARAGHSQHQLGTAIDFGSKENGDVVGSSFDSTKAAKWLVDNGWKYGFVIGYPKGSESVTRYNYESWHYRYIGVGNAKMMKESGVILEEFLK